jgi:tetratricopeptide (TPR) repeat protein
MGKGRFSGWTARMRRRSEAADPFVVLEIKDPRGARGGDPPKGGIDRVADFRSSASPSPMDDPDRFTEIGGLAMDNYRRTGRPKELEAALSACRDAVTVTPLGHPARAGRLSNLAASLGAHFEQTGDVADLEEAISVTREAVNEIPPDSPERAAILSNLAGALHMRFQRFGDLADLDAAIQAVQEAVAVTPPGQTEYAGRTKNLGAALRTRFDRLGHVTDLNAAIQAARLAVAATPPDHPDYVEYISSLGISLSARFDRFGKVADLDEAILVTRQALATIPPDHPNHAWYLSNVGGYLRTRFERVGVVSDLNAAIDACHEAVDATHVGHPRRAGYLSSLMGALARRFERTGDSTDLDAAIEFGRQAVSATPPDEPAPASFLSALGISLAIRFGRAGAGADLDEAVQVGRQAVDATPPDRPDRAMYLSNLGGFLLARFKDTGDGGDLDEAVQVGRQAVDATPPDRPDRAMYLASLGSSLLAWFERTQERNDLDEAIHFARQAVDATPTGHSARAGRLSNLGNSLLARFEMAGNDVDLEEAVIAGRQAVDATPADHPDRAARLSNLGGQSFSRFKRTGRVADLDAAIQAVRDALRATPADHPDRAARLSNLGGSLTVRFERFGNPGDLDIAMSMWRQASEVQTGTPRVRLDAARRWGKLAADNDRAKQAAQGYEVAVGLLSAVAWHGLDWATRQDQLAQWAGLASDAAACAVLDGHPAQAVELLEQGRSVLWGQALNLRTDLTRLKEAAPHLAERLDTIRTDLDTPLPDSSQNPLDLSGDTTPGTARRRQEVLELRRRRAREWDQTLTEVRAREGFENFLAPTPYKELATAAVDGPVVLVNTSRYGCHALIVHPGMQQPQVVSLPDLNADTTIDLANQLLQALERSHGTRLEREKARHEVLDLLDWLWDAIAEPVLTSLEFTAPLPADGPWPRVWWCPTGALSVLPIHAAGHHPRHRTTAGVAGEGATVPDRVVSSYTPTLTALVRAREPGQPGPAPQLTIGMPTTPGLAPLPAVTDELAVLASHFPPGTTNAQLVESEATRKAVLDAITTHPWVHLACHAGQAQDDPTLSGFALWDGPLTIADLTATPTQSRDLAFLSACQTATGAFRQLDEAIHLAAAMLFLGYRHVIATMWTIADSPAPDVADGVYTTLSTNGTPEADKTARALHDTVHDLRKQDPTDPLLWAPYTHLGA